MTSKTRKLLEDYDVSNAGAFELSVVMLGYLRQTADDEAEKQRVLESVLNRWRGALERKVAPELLGANRRIAGVLKEAVEALTAVVEELNGET